MKTNKLAAILVSELFEKQEFDESAQTLKEIAKASGISRETARNRVEKLLENGTVEQVWKRGKIRPVPAYRVKR